MFCVLININLGSQTLVVADLRVQLILMEVGKMCLPFLGFLTCSVYSPSSSSLLHFRWLETKIKFSIRNKRDFS